MEEGQQLEMVHEIGTLDPTDLASLQEGETITLSLEEASQLLLDGGQFAPGTYQILTTPELSQDGQVPFEIMHGDQGTLLSFLPQNSEELQQATTEDGQQMMIQIKTQHNKNGQVDKLHQLEGVSEDPPHFENEENSEDLPDPVNFNNSVTTVSKNTELSQCRSVMAGSNTGNNTGNSISDEQRYENETALEEFGNQNTTHSQHAETTAAAMNRKSSTVETIVRPAQTKETEIKMIKKEPKPDLKSPISVSDRTEVVINGKKCVLLVNPDTKEMCAYPLLPADGKRRRGRPKKPPRTAEEIEREREERRNKSDVPAAGGDNLNAVEGLLELSNTGPDGVRRSNRARKKTKTLQEYESLELSCDEEDDVGDAGALDDEIEDEDAIIPGYKKRKLQDTIFQPTFLTPTSEKRPRGRPRRYPPPGQPTTSSIPAVLIPSSNGQTLMMAPLQGVQNLQSLQQQVRSLPQLLPHPATTNPSLSSLPQLLPHSATTNPSLSVVAGVQSLLPANETDIQDASAATLQLDPSSVLHGSNMLVTSLDGESLTLNPDGDSSNLADDKLVDADEKPTIIQIPESLLPMFVPKKDPVRIGLKASERDLEKLKCPKCDFQAYYLQQYQEHIGTHTDLINKCKCCNFNSFDQEELLSHFKESHPKCICSVCDFMAEHAYVIKRHMVRHNNHGCACTLCGKVYKDQYILKMHVKMVHMPAEVLFECNICFKKFTRKAHLKRHLRIHDPEKPFKCPHCDYRGCERSDISKHLLIHEEPKHVCDVCNKAFRHIKNKELHVKRHNGQKDYKCGVCGFYGYTFTDIRKHIERKHGDMKRLVCDNCGLGFNTELLLREHQSTGCEGMIEQALSIATSDGGTSQAMIQIPSSVSVDGQHIMIDGQEISVGGDGAVSITFEQVLAADDEGIQLLEDQMSEEQAADEQIVTMAEDVRNSEAIISQGHNLVLQGQEIIEDENQGIRLDLDHQSSVDELMVDA